MLSPCSWTVYYRHYIGCCHETYFGATSRAHVGMSRGPSQAPVHHCSFSHVSMEAKAMPVCCSSYSTLLWLVFSQSRISWFLCREQNGCVCLCCLHGLCDWLWFNCLANVLQVCSCYQTACDVYTHTPSLQQQKWSSFCWYMSQIKLNTLLLFTLIPKAALGYTNWFTINVWCFRAHLLWVCEWRKGEFVNMQNSCWIFLFMTCACLCMARAFDRRKKTSLIYNEIKLCVYVSGVLCVWCCMCAGHRICCSHIPRLQVVCPCSGSGRGFHIS